MIVILCNDILCTDISLIVFDITKPQKKRYLCAFDITKPQKKRYFMCFSCPACTAGVLTSTGYRSRYRDRTGTGGPVQKSGRDPTGLRQPWKRHGRLRRGLRLVHQKNGLFLSCSLHSVTSLKLEPWRGSLSGDGSDSCRRQRCRSLAIVATKTGLSVRPETSTRSCTDSPEGGQLLKLLLFSLQI